MNRAVKTISGDASVQEAARLMSQHRIGSLIVVEDGRLAGIVTERDIMSRLVAESKDASKTKVEEIMTGDVIAVGPDQDIQDATDVMVERGIKKLPVVKGKRLVGIVTATDICTAEPKIINQLGALMAITKEKKAVAG